METIQSVSITRILCGRSAHADKQENGSIGAAVAINIFVKKDDYILRYAYDFGPIFQTHLQTFQLILFVSAVTGY